MATLAVAMLVCVSASAQQTKPEKTEDTKPEDPRKAEASAIFDEGNELADAGQMEAALEKFEKAYAVYPAPNALLNVARQEQLLGRRLKALRHYREALRSPLLAPKGAEIAKKFILELEVGYGRVDVKGPSGTVVKLGEEEVTLPLPEPLDVEPGKVTVSGRIAGQRHEETVTVAAGQVATVRLRGPLGAPGTVTEEKKDFWTPEHITGVALGGAAVVAAGIGIGFLAAHNSHASDANGFASSVNYVCTPNTTNTCGSYQSSKDSANSAKTGEIISFVAAGALAVGAAVLLVPWQFKKEGSHVSARVIPTGQGILIDGAF